MRVFTQKSTYCVLRAALLCLLKKNRIGGKDEWEEGRYRGRVSEKKRGAQQSKFKYTTARFKSLKEYHEASPFAPRAYVRNYIIDLIRTSKRG